MIGRWRQTTPVGDSADEWALRAQRQAVTIAGLQRELEIAHGTITRQSGRISQLTEQLANAAERASDLQKALTVARGELAAAQAEPKPAVVVEEANPAHWRRRAVIAEQACQRYDRILAELRDRDPEHMAVAGSGPVWGGP